MKMILTIYRNGEKVNEIIEEDEKLIYKNLATALYAKISGRASKTAIEYLNNDMEITQTHELHNIKYIYKYIFVDIRI